MATAPAPKRMTSPALTFNSAPPFWSSTDVIARPTNPECQMSSNHFSFLSLKVFTSFSLSLCIAAVAAPGHAAIAQSPLILGGGNVPGNLALVPSVEYPTVISVANIDAQYNHTASYVGNFDSAKCYSYVREAINHHVFGS